MSRQHDIIVLDSSSDDDDSESEIEIRVTNRGGSGKAPAKKKAKTAVFGDYVLSREEQYLFADDDDSDASADEDDDYDDRDDSFGDGARAFARKRSRPATTKHRKTATRKVAPSRAKPAPPPPSRLTIQRERSDSESDDDDQPFRHSSMVKKMEKARAMRAQLNGSATKAKEPPRRGGGGVIKVHRVVDVNRTGVPTQAKNSLADKSRQTPTLKKPLAARKSAAPIHARAIGPAKRLRRNEDSDDYVDQESSEEESDDGDDSAVVEDDYVESDERERTRKRPPGPGRSKAIEEIESSEEDSAPDFDSDSEEPESEDPSPPTKSTKKKIVSGITSRVATQSSQAKPKPKPQQKKAATQPPKPNLKHKAPPLPPPHRPSPPVPKPPAPHTHHESGSASRSARAVAALPENMSIEDMQAQERQLAYFKQLQKRKQQPPQPVNSIQLPRGRSLPNNARSTNGARKAVSTQSVYRLKRQDSGASVDSTVSSVASREPKQLSRAKGATPSAPPAVRDGFSTTGTRNIITTVSVAADASKSFTSAENINHVPLAHNTSWRQRVQFIRAPLNILPSHQQSRSEQAFSQVKERELCEFDDSGLIAPLADIASPPNISTGDVLTQSYESQENVNLKVRRVIDKSLPVLKECHHRRVQDIIKDMRKSLPWCSQSPTMTGSTRSLPRAPRVSASSDSAPIEHVHSQRIRQAALTRAKTKQLNRLVGTVAYVFGFPRTKRGIEGDDSEDSVYELPHFPETIIEFAEDLAPMRQACTWISVKINVHVEDDPILRYIPYLGDKGRVNIDPKRYHATTLDKDRAIVVDLPEDEKRDGEDPVKTQERIESWQSDTANLVLATRSASDDEVMEYLLCMVIKQCGRSPKVFQALREVGGFAEPITDYDVIQKREETARAISKRLHDLRKCVEAETTSSPAVREYVSQLVRTSNVKPKDDSVRQRLRAPLASFSSNYLQHPDCKGLRSGKSVGHLMEWYRDLFCRRCFSYDCQQHGIQHPQPARRMDPVNPVVKKSGVGLSRAKNAKSSVDNDVIEIDSSSSSSSEESQGEENDDAQSTVSGSVDGEADTADVAAADRRRSRRSNTRASTLASASLKVQEVMVEKERKKLQRKQAKQLQRLVRKVDDSEYLDDSYRDIVGPIMHPLISPDADSSCGVSCWKLSVSLSTEPSDSVPRLSDLSKLLLRKVIPILGDNACIIARLLQRPDARVNMDATDSCALIHRYIEEEKKKADGSNLFSSAAYHDQFHDKSEYRRQSTPYRSSAALHSGNRELIKRTRMNRAQQQAKEREHRYEPCNHVGECIDGKCDCLKRGHDCDKACSCSRDCPNRNHGCKCLPGQCRTKACTCYEAGRECDPDFCFSCGAHEAAVMEFDDGQRLMPASDVGICRNVSLLRGVHKKIGVAFSAIHGWGAYVMEPVRKGELVYEYTGALISDDEAERRGNIYDAMKVSYLFDVNSDEVVDAMRKGNKIKFANHRMQETANLETKILVVRGEHRIALFAKWDLHVGEELFFDYGYTNETAPEWSQLRTPHNTRYADSDLEDDDEELREVLRLQSRSET